MASHARGIGLLGMAAGGILLAMQAAQFPPIAETLRAAEQRLAGVLRSGVIADALELILGLLVAHLGLEAARAAERKRELLHDLGMEHRFVLDRKSWFGKFERTLGDLLKRGVKTTVVLGLIVGSFPAFWSACQALAQRIDALFRLLPEPVVVVYDVTLGADATPVLAFSLKILAGVLLAEAGYRTYLQGVRYKHGPIRKRYTVDGLMPITKTLSWTNIKAGGRLPWQPSDMVGVGSSSRKVADITISNCTTGQTHKTDTIWHRVDLEPTYGEATSISREQLEGVLAALTDCYFGANSADGGASAAAAERDFPGKHVYRFAKKCDLNKTADELKLSKTDLRRILDYLSARKNVAQIDRDDALDKLNDETVFDTGGYFYRTYAVDDNGMPQMLITIEEDTPATRTLSADPSRGYGEDFARRGKIAMVLKFSHGRGPDGEADEDEAEAGAEDSDQEIGTDRNKIRFWKKGWNQYIRYGFGRVASINYHNRFYNYDECWVRSLGGLKRIGYVTDSAGAVAARIRETTFVTKLIGNYDREVDVYDPQLAEADSFGRLLCLLSEYITHSRLYERNRLNNLQRTVALQEKAL